VDRYGRNMITKVPAGRLGAADQQADRGGEPGHGEDERHDHADGG